MKLPAVKLWKRTLFPKIAIALIWQTLPDLWWSKCCTFISCGQGLIYILGWIGALALCDYHGPLQRVPQSYDRNLVGSRWNIYNLQVWEYWGFWTHLTTPNFLAQSIVPHLVVINTCFSGSLIVIMVRCVSSKNIFQVWGVRNWFRCTRLLMPIHSCEGTACPVLPQLYNYFVTLLAKVSIAGIKHHFQKQLR